MITKKFEEEVFFTTTRITITKDQSQGSSIGTGFLLQTPLGDSQGREVTLLISNKHVFVDPKSTIAFNFNRKTADGSPDFGNTLTFSGSDFSSTYYEHPDPTVDLACINASNVSHAEHNVYYKNLLPGMLADFTEDSLIPGLEVLFVGYPENRYDVKNNLPLLRRGHIASLPRVDFNLKSQFVIDAQVFQGSSGSAVFAPINGQFKILGVVTETMIKHGQLQTIPTLQTGLGVQQILGLGIVIKSTLVKELIDIAVSKINEILKKKDEPTSSSENNR